MRSILSLSALALVGVLALGAPRAEAADPIGPIAVVDMVRLIQEHPESQQLDKQLKAVDDKAKADWDMQKENLDNMARDIQLLSRNDPVRRRKEKQFEAVRVNAEFNRKWTVQQGMVDYVRSLERLYKAVAMQVRQYARLNGVSLVIQKVDSEKEIGAQSPEDFGLKQRLRVVVYHATQVDITDAVLAQMKSSVGAGAGAGAGTPVPPRNPSIGVGEPPR